MISALNKVKNGKNICEDLYIIEEDETYIQGAIMDGCSTGINSGWIVQTVVYILKKLFRRTSNFNILYSLDFLFSELRTTSALFQLDSSNNLLFTFIPFRYNKQTKVFEIRTFGDCTYFINDVQYVVDQGNAPDYLGYYIRGDYKKFAEYTELYPVIEYSNVDRFIICSDGIDKISISQFVTPVNEPLNLLLHPPTSTNYLDRMWNKLSKDHYYLDDDLTIISYESDRV